MAKPLLTIEKIQQMLPHRYPMLLVDRVLEVGEDHIVATKLVSANEPFFPGHFPDFPIMPGVLIVEAMAQAAGLWAMLRDPSIRDLGAALASVDRARFRRPVVPGDLLELNVRLLRSRKRMFKAEGTASVDGEVAASAELMAAFVDRRPGADG